MEKILPFNVSTFEHGPRSPAFRSLPGPLETRSVELINACLHGNKDAVQSLLIVGDLSPDVSDCSGFTPLQAAVVSVSQIVFIRVFSLFCLVWFILVQVLKRLLVTICD